jgi:DNA-binding transcriptional ArsR family regulator
MSNVERSQPRMSGTDLRAETRRRSKRLFGNADRLEVALAVAESTGLVHAQELADQLGISPPRVRAQLLAFVDAGVMTVLPRSGLIQNYERLDDPFWSFVSEVMRSWHQRSAGPSTIV